ncbi:hypothetical protein F528_1665 [Neisseria meningitidis 992008]|nr:hypothetical protein F528_2531 [Neisseria meningitidis 992008]KER39350.1 hypothetical protein F528_1665 [Neisseria meningitidis 992008]
MVSMFRAVDYTRLGCTLKLDQLNATMTETFLNLSSSFFKCF